MRLLIAIPCMDNVRWEFAQSLTKLCKRLSEIGIDYDVHFHEGSLIYMARDELANVAIDEGYTHVLWLDSDIQFSSDIVEILYGKKKAFITGIYRSRRKPFAICIYSDLEHGQRQITLPNELFTIDACGFGCVLMETDVLKIVRRNYGVFFLPTVSAGEDIAFCKRWTDLGFSIYADPDARCGHITCIPITPKDTLPITQYMDLI